jgi:CRP-like cAMP-binding protein
VEQMKRTGRNSFRIPDKQQELAEIFASTRPSVGRIFRELHRSGIIHAKGKEVVIKDRKRLIDLLRNRT